MQTAWNTHGTAYMTILHTTCNNSKIFCSFRSRIIFLPHGYICGAVVVCLYCL